MARALHDSSDQNWNLQGCDLGAKEERDLCSSFRGAELFARCNQRLSESGGKPGIVKINFTPRFTLTWICISLRGWEKFNMSIMQRAGRIERFYGFWLNGEDERRHAQSPITSQAWKQITPNWQNYTKQILSCRIACPLSQYVSFSSQWREG